MGVYTVKQRTSTTIMYSYMVDGSQVRERFALVAQGTGFSKRLAETKREAAKKLTQAMADVNAGRVAALRTRRGGACGWSQQELRARCPSNWIVRPASGGLGDTSCG